MYVIIIGIIIVGCGSGHAALNTAIDYIIYGTVQRRDLPINGHLLAS